MHSAPLALELLAAEELPSATDLLPAPIVVAAGVDAGCTVSSAAEARICDGACDAEAEYAGRASPPMAEVGCEAAGTYLSESASPASPSRFAQEIVPVVSTSSEGWGGGRGGREERGGDAPSPSAPPEARRLPSPRPAPHARPPRPRPPDSKGKARNARL